MKDKLTDYFPDTKVVKYFERQTENTLISAIKIINMVILL